MTMARSAAGRLTPPITALNARHAGLVLILAAAALTVAKPALPAGLVRPPDALTVPFADWFNAAINFIAYDLGLIHVTRTFAAAVQWLLDVTANLLYGKNRWPRIGPVPWTVLAVGGFMVGYTLKGWRLALLSGGMFAWLALFGQWKWAMETLSVIVVAAPFAVALGLLLGVAAWRWRWLEWALNPLLNLAQSLPHFAYMIPVVVFIGVGPKAGAIATIIFAMPPMVRMSLLGLKRVAPEIIEAGAMSGADRRQLLWKVRLPSARDDLLLGVNQVIMQCLAMVVLAAFIGMPGLGVKLLQLMQALKIGRSIELGISIVLIAIALDRCSKAWVELKPMHLGRAIPWWDRHRLFLIWAALTAAAFALAEVWPLADQIPRRAGFSAAPLLDWAVDRLLLAISDSALTLRSVMSNYVLIPIRNAFLYLPTAAVFAFLAGVGWLIGGARSALICLAYVGFIALSGWWDRAMITAYTVVVAVTLAAVIGFPLGIWAARSERRASAVLITLDTAQTFPSFIYIIPMIMLFGVTDIAVVGSVIIFGMVPLARYTIEGLRGVPASLLEAADMAGASRRQKLWNVQLPLALPTIMVGVNQSVLFSLFMVIIAAFIGTQDLGQEMQRALSASDFGKGMTLGLCVAFMGLTMDHLAMRWAADRRRVLGLD